MLTHPGRPILAIYSSDFISAMSGWTVEMKYEPSIAKLDSPDGVNTHGESKLPGF